MTCYTINPYGVANRIGLLQDSFLYDNLLWHNIPWESHILATFRRILDLV